MKINVFENNSELIILLLGKLNWIVVVQQVLQQQQLNVFKKKEETAHLLNVIHNVNLSIDVNKCYKLYCCLVFSFLGVFFVLFCFVLGSVVVDLTQKKTEVLSQKFVKAVDYDNQQFCHS